MSYVYCYFVVCTIIFPMVLIGLYVKYLKLTLADLIKGFIFSYLPAFNIITILFVLGVILDYLFDRAENIIIFKRKDKQ